MVLKLSRSLKKGMGEQFNVLEGKIFWVSLSDCGKSDQSYRLSEMIRSTIKVLSQNRRKKESPKYLRSNFMHELRDLPGRTDTVISFSIVGLINDLQTLIPGHDAIFDKQDPLLIDTSCGFHFLTASTSGLFGLTFSYQRLQRCRDNECGLLL